MVRRIVASALATGVATVAVVAGVAAASSSTSVVASVIPANGSPFVAPGKVVNSSGLSDRVFVNQSHGFSLWTGSGVTYPACTSDGGKAWVVCGPHMHVPAMNAPNVVTQVGAQGDQYFAYGGPAGAESIVVSTNEKTWYRAYLPGVPYAVTAASNGNLFAFVVTGKSVTEWTSSNAGRTWKES